MEHRIERAKQLLHSWAFKKFRPDNVVDLDYEAGYTSESVLNDFNMVDTTTYRNKKKITARAAETRSHRGSRLPVGGNCYNRSVGELCRMVDAMFKESFSKRQLMLLIALFAPAACLKLEDRKVPDSKIGRMMGFKPARVSQIKTKAVEIVVRNLFTPEEETKDRMTA